MSFSHVPLATEVTH